MKIIALRVKTDVEEERDTLNLIKDFGIEGDKKAKGGDRQLVLADEAKLSSYRAKGEGLCIGRFMPNITTDGLDYSTQVEGNKFTVGEAEIEISGISKKCFPECPLVKRGTVCDIKKNCAFAKITKSGTVKIGDEIVEG